MEEITSVLYKEGSIIAFPDSKGKIIVGTVIQVNKNKTVIVSVVTSKREIQTWYCGAVNKIRLATRKEIIRFAINKLKI